MTGHGAAPRIAVVGAGPAGAYAVGQLLARGLADINVFDRLPTPGGLVRAGVAPDHPTTKHVERTFGWWLSEPGVSLHLGIEVGRDITAAELASLHHAVIYTSGASSSRSLNIPGEDLTGSHAATEFVGWYNGHPDYADAQFNLTTDRAVIVGNGNVALDVARILTVGVERLGRTDIADHALAALTSNAVREVVVLGRRGPVEAGFTTPELMALTRLEGVDVIVKVPGGLSACDIPGDLPFPAKFAARRKLEVLAMIGSRSSSTASRRIVLQFLQSPVQLHGDGHVESISIARNELITRDGRMSARATDQISHLDTGLVLRSVGYFGRPIPGVPFDAATGRIPNLAGRVLDADGMPVPGLYTAGWIKRGPSGVIGTNKRCAEETVQSLLDDLAAGLLPEPKPGALGLNELLGRRSARPINLAGWRAIDGHERAAGVAQRRPRVKICDLSELATVAALGSVTPLAQSTDRR